MERIQCIAWDFDGVLNRNVVDGRFIWQERLGELGIDRDAFDAFMFADGFWPVMRGEVDILYRLGRFLYHIDHEGDAGELLQFWFEADAFPDAKMLQLMARVQAAGLRQVIATNNEHRRSQYIETEMGYGDRVEAFFSSGRMGAAKPDAAFFRAIEAELVLEPSQILFVDDYHKNIDGAAACGWQVHHFAQDGHDQLQERLAAIL